MNVQELVNTLRAHASEDMRVEVKAASGGLPSSARETISAFANTHGGTIILGLHDVTFAPVEIDALRLRDGLAGIAADDFTPPVRGEVSIELVDGNHRVVVMQVPELSPDQKPCYVTNRSRYGGSYIRVEEGDRRLTAYEIDRLLENRTQPVHDQEIVLDATLDDLDPDLLTSLLTRVRSRGARAFADLDDTECLRRLNVIRMVDQRPHPTLAGLLACGHYPQQFFPQLGVTLVVVPTTTLGDPGALGERFTDNRMVEGPLADIVAETTAVLTRHMSRASVVLGTGRTDRLEYPAEVIRELLVNALMHRDYSPGARGTGVQVELYPDRLVVRNPGGFYGPVDPEAFGEPDISSSRNAVLARLLSDLPGRDGQLLAENRGSGIPTVLRTLGRAGMMPPTFRGTLALVEVTVTPDTLLDIPTQEWISDLRQDHLTQHQVQALALMHSGRPVTNQTLQGWGAHPSDATRDLVDLVRRGLTLKRGERRDASYILNPDLSLTRDVDSLTGRQARIVELITAHGELGTRDIAQALDVSYGTALNDIAALIDQNQVEATAPPRNRNRRYRIAHQENR